MKNKITIKDLFYKKIHQSIFMNMNNYFKLIKAIIQSDFMTIASDSFIQSYTKLHINLLFY